MRKGYVKWYSPRKNYGFIRAMNKKGEWFEVFFHSSEIHFNVQDGDSVVFEVHDSMRGPVAINIRKRKKSEVT